MIMKLLRYLGPHSPWGPEMAGTVTAMLIICLITAIAWIAIR